MALLLVGVTPPYNYEMIIFDPACIHTYCINYSNAIFYYGIHINLYQ